MKQLWFDQAFHSTFHPIPRLKSRKIIEGIKSSDIRFAIADAFCHFLENVKRAMGFYQTLLFLSSAFAAVAS